MLNPHDRTSLFEALRPPTGYHLEAGVGTSFSLNLEAMLTAPIAFALFDVADDLDSPETDQSSTNPSQAETNPSAVSKREADAVTLEPVGLLESIRRYADRLTVFCQAGQIALPTSGRTIYAWLEDAVVEATAHSNHRLFHPKVWVCRYRNDSDHTAVLRLLCATRNLTLDSSLDTLLVLDSEPFHKRPLDPISRQQSAADFVAELPQLSNRALARDRRDQIEDLAQDLRYVSLLTPEPFTNAAFHMLGATAPASVFPMHSDRAVIVSPFVGNRFLDEFTSTHDVALLLSREAALDRIDPAILRRIDRVATLNPNAGFDNDQDVESERDATERELAPPNATFGGLHAKLFAFDIDGNTHVFTGSANATEAAFDGNIEALVELVGPAENGIATLLEETPGEVGFDDLCIDYNIVDEPPLPEVDDQSLTFSLDWFRHQIAAAGFQAVVDTGDDGYQLTLTSDRPLPIIDAEHISMSVWPISLFEDASAVTVMPGTRMNATFEVSLEGLTSFFAIRTTATSDTDTAKTVFVVNAVLQNAPDDRHSKLLSAMLRDPDRLLQYLLLLLSDASDQSSDPLGAGMQSWLGKWQGKGWDEVPLLELLVRAASRHPERLDHIDALLTDLGDSRIDTVPKGFDSIWEPIWEYRRSHRK